jgi:hypothetical protein
MNYGTKAQIDDLQKALPRCTINSNLTKQPQSFLPVKALVGLGDVPTIVIALVSTVLAYQSTVSSSDRILHSGA